MIINQQNEIEPMPDDIPKAVKILLWLLTGVIVFGWLLMEYETLYSIVFALVYFGLPVLANKKAKKDDA